jgi:ubiquitin-activating enzyme E1
MGTSSVLIVGLKGLGVEIAKNVILMGIGMVDLLDPGKVEIGDLSANFYLKESDIGKPRDQCCLQKLVELNKYVKVNVVNGIVKGMLDYDLLSQKKYQVVVMTETSLGHQIQINNFCHDKGIKFISGDTRGLFSSVFVDLGEEHIITDINGERPQRGLISNISQGNRGIVQMADNSRHGLSDGHYVTFEEEEGMTEVNNTKPIQTQS